MSPPGCVESPEPESKKSFSSASTGCSSVRVTVRPAPSTNGQPVCAEEADPGPRMSTLVNCPVLMESPHAPLNEGESEPPPWKIIVLTEQLLIGLLLSQVLALQLAPDVYNVWAKVVQVTTMCCLSFIMINVGYEFNIDKSRLAVYGADYFIAMTAAGFPWIFVALWFMLALPNPLPWEQALLAARFAAPTSAGILFSMLEGAGLKRTWLFHKARTLAIFDDLDTILLMIPLKVILMGFQGEMIVIVVIMVLLLAVAWVKLHAICIPSAWNWTMFYAVVITGASELLYQLTKGAENVEAIHIEVLLPAFVLGCCVRTAKAERELQEEQQIEHEQQQKKDRSVEGAVSKRFDAAGGKLQKKELESTLRELKMRRSSIREKMDFLSEDVVTLEDYHEACNDHAIVVVRKEEETDLAAEEREQSVATAVSFVFMVLVGLTMPSMFGGPNTGGHRRLGGGAGSAASGAGGHDEPLGGDAILFHVFAITMLMILGKMYPVLCYRDEATWLERFALCMGMCPRGEVGAGIIVISLDLGISGPAVTIAMLSLAVNLMLSGGFIGIVKLLLRRVVAADALLLKQQVLALQQRAQPMASVAAMSALPREVFQTWRLYVSLRRRQDERRQRMQNFWQDYYVGDEKLFEADVQCLLREHREAVHMRHMGRTPSKGSGVSKVSGALVVVDVSEKQQQDKPAMAPTYCSVVPV